MATTNKQQHHSLQEYVSMLQCLITIIKTNQRTWYKFTFHSKRRLVLFEDLMEFNCLTALSVCHLFLSASLQNGKGT